MHGVTNVLETADPELFQATQQELERQWSGIELIASENFVSEAVLQATGTVLTNKYAEGYPGKRYYGGCEYVDVAEELAIERAKQLFGAGHANVQPHSGANANMAAYFSIMAPGDRLLGLSLQEGGHLTHGLAVNFSGKLFEAHFYGVDFASGLIDYEQVRKRAIEVLPKTIVAGASAYSRELDYERFRAIADEVGAFLVADIAHPAGLIAAGLHKSPIGHAHITTTTTHKTLRGPRGGMVMADEELGKRVDKSVFPGLQGGPLMHVIAAKAVAFREALQPEYVAYAEAIIRNAKMLAGTLMERGLPIVTGGTDTHLMLVNVGAIGLSGKQAEDLLDSVGITVNKNTIPGDQRPPTQASGIRLGTPAITTRGFEIKDIERIAEMIADLLQQPEDKALQSRTKEEVRAIATRFPLPGYPQSAI